MENALLSALLVVGFAIRIWPRIILKYAINSDTYFHLHCAKLIRDNRFRLPKKFPNVILAHEYTYPPGYHYFLALFPDGARLWVERATGAIFDTLNAALCFYATRWFIAHHAPIATGDMTWVPLWVAALYVFAPSLLRLGSGPRAYSGSARIPGQTLYLVHLFSAYAGMATERPFLLGVSAVAGAVMIFTSLFSTQSMVFIGILFAIFVSPYYLLLLLVCFLLSPVFSLGHGIRVVRACLIHINLYYHHLQRIALFPLITNFPAYVGRLKRGFLQLAKGRWKDFAQWYFHETYKWHILVTSFPQYLILPALFFFPSVGPEHRFLLVWMVAGFVWFIATKVKPLLFLGEGERYLESAIYPSLYFFVVTCYGAPWILWALFAYSLLTSIHFRRDYLRSYRFQEEDFLPSSQLFEKMARLPAGVIMPLGWVHYQCVMRSPYPVLSHGAMVDTTLLPLEEFLLVYGHYPYPGSDLKTIIEKYDVQYIVADRACLEHYLDKCISDAEYFPRSTLFVDETPGLFFFITTSGIDRRFARANEALQAGDVATAKNHVADLAQLLPKSEELRAIAADFAKCPSVLTPPDWSLWKSESERDRELALFAPGYFKPRLGGKLEKVARRLFEDGHRTAIVCGAAAGPCREAAQALRKLGVEVLAYTDRDPGLYGGEVEGTKVVRVPTGVKLGAAAMLIAAAQFTREIEQEIIDSCNQGQVSMPKVYTL